MHSNPTAVEVAGKLLFDIKQDHAAPRDWAERLGKVVQLIHEERVAELTEEIELLQHALSRQGKMLSAIVNITKGPPEENTLHSTHDAVESVERLQARVAELYDLIKYAQVDSGVCMCGDDIKDHNQSSGHSPVDVWDHAVEQVDKGGTSEALILRKQAEAVQASRQAVSVPEGWKLVPINPTIAMVKAAFDALEVVKPMQYANGTAARNAVYASMIAAAPQPPQQEQDQ